MNGADRPHEDCHPEGAQRPKGQGSWRAAPRRATSPDPSPALRVTTSAPTGTATALRAAGRRRERFAFNPRPLGPRPAMQPHAITRMLIEASGGNRDAFDKLLPVVYAELRRVARC